MNFRSFPRSRVRIGKRKMDIHMGIPKDGIRPVLSMSDYRIGGHNESIEHL